MTDRLCLLQMVVCVSDDESSEEEHDITKKPKDKDRKYMHNHGSKHVVIMILQLGEIYIYSAKINFKLNLGYF